MMNSGLAGLAIIGPFLWLLSHANADAVDSSDRQRFEVASLRLTFKNKSSIVGALQQALNESLHASTFTHPNEDSARNRSSSRSILANAGTIIGALNQGLNDSLDSSTFTPPNEDSASNGIRSHSIRARQYQFHDQTLSAHTTGTTLRVPPVESHSRGLAQGSPDGRSARHSPEVHEADDSLRAAKVLTTARMVPTSIVGLFATTRASVASATRTIICLTLVVIMLLAFCEPNTQRFLIAYVPPYRAFRLWSGLDKFAQFRVCVFVCGAEYQKYTKSMAVRITAGSEQNATGLRSKGEIYQDLFLTIRQGVQRLSIALIDEEGKVLAESELDVMKDILEPSFGTSPSDKGTLHVCRMEIARGKGTVIGPPVSLKIRVKLLHAQEPFSSNDLQDCDSQQEPEPEDSRNPVLEDVSPKLREMMMHKRHSHLTAIQSIAIATDSDPDMTLIMATCSGSVTKADGSDEEIYLHGINRSKEPDGPQGYALGMWKTREDMEKCELPYLEVDVHSISQLEASPNGDWWSFRYNVDGKIKIASFLRKHREPCLWVEAVETFKKAASSRLEAQPDAALE